MEPTAETLIASLAVNPVPRKFPVPEGPAGPPPVFASIVAAPVVAQAQQLLNPVAADIVGLIRGVMAGTPDALRRIGQNLPPPAAVFSGASLGFGIASLAVGLTGQAAALLSATPVAAVPYLGAATAAYGAASPAIAAALGAAGGGFGALGQVAQQGGAFDFSSLTRQWGNLLPGSPAAGAIPPPPTVV